MKTAKAGFFDGEAVLKALSKEELQVLSKMGAFVRTSARSSIRRRKGISDPGRPPSAHSGEIKLIYFAWDGGTRSVVVGPILAKGGIAEIIEEGGDETREDRRTKRQMRMHYRARPFMGPARDANIDKFPELWRDKVR